MAASRLRVVIAGAGVAGLEALLGLSALAGERVELTLVAPEDDFVYRPLAGEAPCEVGRLRSVPVRDAARDARAEFAATTIEAVDPGGRTVRAANGRELGYNALVLAVGAEPMPAVPGVLTWDDRADSELIGGLLRDIEDGYSRRLVVVIPAGPGWVLRGYELALFITHMARGMGAELETTVVAPEPAPLSALGGRPQALVSAELDRAGVAVLTTAEVDVERGHAVTVVLRPSGRRLEVDRVLALPVLRGRRIAGIPSNADGFIEVDELCRARGVDAVWAAGDDTAFPGKSGGVAAEQADVVAESIAAMAGAAVGPHAFDPMSREGLAGLPAGRFLKAWLAADDTDGLTTHLPPSGVPVVTYLRKDLEAGWRGYG